LNQCQIPDKSIIFPSSTWGDSLWGKAIREKRPFSSAGPFQTPEGHVRIDSFLAVPIVFQNETIGQMSVANKEGGYTEEDQNLLQSIVFNISPILHARLQGDRQERKRKQAEEQLRQLTRRQETLLDAIPDIVMEADTNKVYTWANPAGYAFFGDDVIGKDAAKYLVGEQDTYPKVESWFNGDSGLSYVESWQRRKDGENRLLGWWCKTLKDSEGRVTGALLTARDITDLRRTEEALRESEERYRLLVESASETVLLRRGDGIIVYANPAALELLHATKREELVGRNYLDFVHPDGREESVRRIRRSLAEGWVAPRREHRLVALDGQVIDVESTGLALIYRGQRHLLGVFHDITERKKGEKEKVALQEQLQHAQKMEAIGTLAGGIAHDFNNILTAILGYAELASFNMPEDSDAQNNIQQALKAARRAKDLVKQILAFSRQGQQERKPLDIRPIVKEGIKFLRASLPSTIEIRQSIEGELGVIEADPTQIHQVLMNLCTNASHAMRERGGILEVSLTKFDLLPGLSSPYPAMGPGPYLKLRVKDTGSGIPAEVLPKIFDPYFTTKEVGEGTGLGLAVVHGIIKSYKGGITVSSEPGKGTTFEIYIPRIETPKVPIPSDHKEPLPLGGRERILFVDDESAIAEIARSILEHLGYEVEVRTSSIEAREKFRANPDRFDLVITDMTMPNMTGDRLAQEILSIRPGMPIILCTGFSELITEEKARALGIQEFIMKPLVMKDLAVVIHRALDRKKQAG
jgi:PAS domain S-box-containing protein